MHHTFTICTKDSFGHDIYKGDLGSPVVSQSKKLIGIASWFAPSSGVPDVFTAILPFTEWIKNTIDNYDSLYMGY